MVRQRCERGTTLMVRCMRAPNAPQSNPPVLRDSGRYPSRRGRAEQPGADAHASPSHAHAVVGDYRTYYPRWHPSPAAHVYVRCPVRTATYTDLLR
jgi:hypothetical protein